jgi:Ras-related protein Rab-1A
MSHKQQEKQEKDTKTNKHDQYADSENIFTDKFESKISEEKQDNLLEEEPNNFVVEMGDDDFNRGESSDFNEEKDKSKENIKSESIIETKIISDDSKSNDKLTYGKKEIENDKKIISPVSSSNNDFEVINKDSFKPSPFSQGNNLIKDKELSPYIMIEKENDRFDMHEEIKEAEAELNILQSSPADQENKSSIDSNDKVAINEVTVNIESQSPLISVIQTNNEIQIVNESEAESSKKSSSINIPILNKLMSSSDNINFDIKEKIEINNYIELNKIKNDHIVKDNIKAESKEIKNENYIQKEENNQIINENLPSPNTRANIALGPEIEFRHKFEKILNTNLEVKHQLRICIVGDSNVGKTALLTRYCDDTFKSSMTNTIGVDFRALMLRYNDMNIKLQIWDTAGQERFKSISVNYFRSANGFIFVYDIANHVSFENLNNWIEIVQQHNKNSVCSFIVGNKCDLEENRQVSIEEGKNFAFSKKFNFMETSAKSAKNVDIAFEMFTFKLIEHFNLTNNNKGEDSSSNNNISNGKRFKIEDVYDEISMSKKKKKTGCQC